ncbi:MAG: hypothetical protein AMS20_11725 [Gemmatimonas sp. SG8_28]|jgi:hypothetical protein|nr:MAG: hypothetical protein AMS20_11725 [Gemmatimonas sp. SG8_28]
MRQRSLATIALLAAGAFVLAAAAQSDNPLLKRWVGTHDNQPLVLDFYGDSMVLVNDEHVADFSVQNRSISVFGDTSFTVRYWFALDRLLLETEDGAVLTMAEQDPLARPMFGTWRGSEIASGRRLELWLGRGGVARWRPLSGGGWTGGEWDRSSRTIRFTWLPDSTVWVAQYDPPGGALLFDQMTPESGMVVLRHVYR